MSLYLRLMPGVKIRIGRRGVRAGIGPRWLRRWGGRGGGGWSSGAGPLSVYVPDRRRRRRRQPGSSGGSGTARHPAILGALALFSFAWPWLVLHGVAMIVAGVLWTLFLLLTATAVMAGRQGVRRGRRR
jgi:hypothetical protein